MYYTVRLPSTGSHPHKAPTLHCSCLDIFPRARPSQRSRQLALRGLARLAQVASLSPPAGYGRKRNSSSSSFNAGYSYQTKQPLRPGHTLMNTDCNRTRLKAATKGSPKVHCSSMPHESQSTPRSPRRGPSNIPRHSSRASCRSLCTSTTTHCESPPFLRKPPACTAHTRPLGNDDSPDQSGDQWINVYLTLHCCTRNHQRSQAEPEHTY